MYLSRALRVLLAGLVFVGGTLNAQETASGPVEGTFKFVVKFGDTFRNAQGYCEGESQKIAQSINDLVSKVHPRGALPFKVHFVDCEALGWDGAFRNFKVRLQVIGRTCIRGNPALYPFKREYRLHDWSLYSNYSGENSSAALDSLGIRFFLLKDQTQLLLLPDCGRAADSE